MSMNDHDCLTPNTIGPRFVRSIKELVVILLLLGRSHLATWSVGRFGTRSGARFWMSGVDSVGAVPSRGARAAMLPLERRRS